MNAFSCNRKKKSALPLEKNKINVYFMHHKTQEDKQKFSEAIFTNNVIVFIADNIVASFACY